ncbi:hypothetical protein SmJEL517_g03477 [Synchytrium microbalum]|uniref:UBX domain-containing protein n=1 Tax=Synchytrium microbalum TaxID=1806994 RepID=A0A507C8B8_9FUNG|nr:uncharacterized protein SmJEL517_g03477 [Synchytrium microbalum]TPX33745.1 hypothetical protein SmJEL517_g03477 [Synchytrium microbalum]
MADDEDMNFHDASEHLEEEDHAMASTNDDAMMTFMSATDASPEQARNYLMYADNNIETAVSLFFETGGDLSPGNPTASTSTPTPALGVSGTSIPIPRDVPVQRNQEIGDEFRQHLSQQGGDGYRAPIAPTRQVLNEVEYDEEFEAMRHRARQQLRTVLPGALPGGSSHQFVEPFRDFEREGVLGRGGGSANDGAPRLSDLYAPPHDMMYRSGLKSAREKATNEKKWIMITVQDGGEFLSVVQNKDLWKDESVKEIVKSNFIFILHMANTQPGQEHKSYYPFDKYPYIAIIDPLTGERVKQWSKKLTPEEFIMDIMDFLDSGPVVATKPKKKKKEISELSEEEQLEAAIRASMGQSAMDESEDADEEGSDASSPPQPTNGKETSVLTTAVKKEDVKAEGPAKVKSEGTSDDGGASLYNSIKPRVREEPTTGDITRIQIRGPDGRPVVRKFVKTDLVRYIFEFVKASVPGGDRPFELFNVRVPLSKHMDSTLQETNCIACSLTMDYQ